MDRLGMEMMRVLLVLLSFVVVAPCGAQESADRQTFELDGLRAFVMEPPEENRQPGPMPWVWYAPTLGKNLPGSAEQWMLKHLHAKGIALAGIDVGESFGSPQGRAGFQLLFQELVAKRGYSKRPVLLARSRGGLMLYNWAVEHPQSVAGIAGIYPVCNIASYPGIAKAAPAYGLTTEQLTERLSNHNPVDRLKPLADAKVPIFHIQGDSDRVVPHEKNTGLLAERYRTLGGNIEFELVKGQGHHMWRGWFESERLTEFMIERALKGRREE